MVKKKQGSGPRATVEKKPPLSLLWEKLSALPRRALIFGGAAVALVIIVLLLAICSKRQPMPSQAPPQAAADLPTRPGGSLERPLEQPAPPLQTARAPEKEEERPIIQSIRLTPNQPTRMDTLKAEVTTAAYPGLNPVTFAYEWKVNNQIVTSATGATLNLASFKKRDLVTVTITPVAGGISGFPAESPVSVIYGVPPSLDLQAPVKTEKAGEPRELQLVSLHRDSEEITFTLEPPLVPGMSIDRQTGKITWLIKPNQKGTLRFGAAVEDGDKTKVTKTFDITIE